MQTHHPKWQYRAVCGTAVAVGLTGFVIACSDRELQPTAPVLTPVTTTASLSADSALPYTTEKAKSRTNSDGAAATVSTAPAMSQRGAASMDLAAARRMFEEWAKSSSGRRFKVDFSLTLKAIDAMAAPTQEERRRILAELPIKLERTFVGTDAAGRQIMRTRVIVRGVEKPKLTYDRVVAERTGNPGPDVEAIDQPLEDGEPLGENSITVAAVEECPDDPNDCMTDPEVEDAELEYAAIASDAYDTESTAAAVFQECINVYECYEQTYSTHLTTGFMLEGGSQAGLQECAPDSFTPNGFAPNGFNCWYLGVDWGVKCGAFVGTLGGIGWSIFKRSVLGFIASVGAAWVAGNECRNASDAFENCYIEDSTTSFGSGLLKEETVFVRAH